MIRSAAALPLPVLSFTMSTASFRRLSLLLLASALGGSTDLFPTMLQGQESAVPNAPIFKNLKPGPWGGLESYPVFLQAPEAALKLLPSPSQQTVWRFFGTTRDEVSALFQKFFPDPDLYREATVRSVWYLTPEEVRVHPTDRMVLALPPLARLELMQTLGKYEENPFHYNPLVIEGQDVRAWFAGTGLSEPVLAAIEATSFPFRNGRILTEVSYALSKVDDEIEEANFLRAMTRNRSLFLRLRLTSHDTLAPLLDYWSQNIRLKETQPIMESIIRTPGVERLDLTHILPPTARKYLYTFPTTAEGINGIFPNSLWTSLNFFEFSPKVRYNSPDKAAEQLQSHFERVLPPFRYGDVITLVEPTTGKLLHSCIFIADNVVYSKNNSSMLTPWVLQTDADMMTHLTRITEFQVVGWRHTST